MKKGKLFTKSIAILLAMVMLFGVIAAAALPEDEADFLAEDFIDLDFSGKGADAFDLSDRTYFADDLDLSAYSSADKNFGFIRDTVSASGTSLETIEYVESVAEAMTEPEGIIGVDGDDDEVVYVFVWLQELPQALERVYRSEGRRNSRYESARRDGASARSTIRNRNGGRGRSSVNITHEYKEVFSGFALEATVAELREMAELDGVYAITEMYYYELHEDTQYILDPTYALPGNAPARELWRISEIHAAGITGEGVKVGIIDSGIDPTHPDLVDVFRSGWVYVSGLPTSNTNNMSRPDGSHGTHVAGTVASTGKSTSLGMAPGVDLYALQVFGGNNGGAGAVVMEAVEDASQGNPARGIPKLDVINMSLGVAMNSPSAEANNTAYEAGQFARNNAVVAGTVVVASAGNNANYDGSATYAGQRNPYTTTSGGASLPISVAAAQVGGNLIMSYSPVVSSELGEGDLNFYVENFDAAIAGVFRDGSFGSQEQRIVPYGPISPPESVFTHPLVNYVIDPLEFIPGKGYEIYYACANNVPTPGGNNGSDMTLAEITALNALPAGSLKGKILAVNRGQAFFEYKVQALRLGAAGLIVINRDEAIIGNLNIGGETSAKDLLIFSAPASFKKTLYDLVAGNTQTAYLDPGTLNLLPHATEPTDFSSIGPVRETAEIKPDVIAPGFQILSTLINGGYGLMGGTSMSSPAVAGVAALLLQKFPNATPAEIKARLMNTADPFFLSPHSINKNVRANSPYFVRPEGTQVSVFEQGAGFVDAWRAIMETTVYITVENEVPTNNPNRETQIAQKASLSFGNQEAGTTTDKLTGTVHGGVATAVEVIYRNDTRFSQNSTGNLVVNVENKGATFDVWLVIDEEAVSTPLAGNLYEGYIKVTVGEDEFLLPWGVRVGEPTPPPPEFGEYLGFSQRSILSTSTSNQVRSSAQETSGNTAGRSSSRSTFWLVWQGIMPSGIDVFLMDPDTFDLKYYITTINAAGIDNPGSAVYQVGQMFNRTAGRINADGTITANQVIADGAYVVVSGIGDMLYGYLDMGIVYTSGTGEMAVQLTFDTDDRGRIAVSGDAAVGTAAVSGRIYSPAMALAEEYGFIWTDRDDILDDMFFLMDQSTNMLAWAGTGDMFITSGGQVAGYYLPPGATAISHLWVCDEDGYFTLNIPVSQVNKDGGWVFANGTNRSIVGVEGVYWTHGLTSGNAAAWNLIGANKSAAVANLQFGIVLTVSFDSAGGSGVDPIVIYERAAIAPPAEPTLYGYTFAGWYLGEEAFDFSTVITQNITLTAKWILNPITSLRIGLAVEGGEPTLAAPMIQIGRNASLDLEAIIGEGSLPVGIVWTVNNANLATIEFGDDGTAKVLTKGQPGNVTVTARAPSGVTHSIILRVL